ncbi:MAG: S8 family serine peptidase [Opitutaceae bacterium]
MPSSFSRLRVRLAFWIALAGWAPALRAATSSSVGPAHLFTPKELAQGFRDGYVLALPRTGARATVGAEEAVEGTPAAGVFARFGGLRLLPTKPGETTASAIARLQATGRYAFVEPDRIVHADQAAPNDPDFGQQWGLDNTPSNSPDGTPNLPGADIHAAGAWATRTDASTVVVAVIDSGLRLTHQDIAANLWTNPEANEDNYTNDYNGIDASGYPQVTGDPNDDLGHGTHVAGIIGAVGDNGLDTSGVCWKVRIMPLKFIGADGTGPTSGEIACIEFAIDHGANLINASFGSDSASASEETAFQDADQAGIICVVAAGNNAEDNGLTSTYPSTYPLDNIVAVAASDNRDDLASFSEYGSGNVDLAAPGYDILSLYNTSDTATAVLSGTSMAAPMVTGSLALLKAQFPGDSPRQLINRLLRHVDPGPNFIGRVQTGGRVDLAAALQSAAGDNTPFNDDFASRGHLAGTSISVRSDNTGATLEAGEPAVAGQSGGASLWWDWTAPETGMVTLQSAGSAYPTLLGIYTGTVLSSLTAVASSSSGVLSFSAEAGTTYEISVEGQGGASGLTILQLGYANDAFASPAWLAGPSASITAGNTAATRESGEPTLNASAVGHSVWYAWTAPGSGQYQVSVTSLDFDPVLGIFTGASLSGLTRVAASAAAASIDADADSPVAGVICTFDATAGTTYRILVDGAADATTGLSSGQFTLSLADSRWQSATGDAITCSPTVGPGGSIYVGSTDGLFYAFNPDGSAAWTYDPSVIAGLGSTTGFDTSSAAVGSDGTVYAGVVGSDGGAVFALSSAGALKWSYVLPASGAYPTCSPILAADGSVVFKDSSGYLDDLDASTGALRSQASVPGLSYAAPAIAPDGTIYSGTDADVLYAIASNGSPKWTFDAGGPIYTSAAIDAGGQVYFGTLTGACFAVNAQGRQVWTQTLGNSVTSSPALGSNGAVYLGCYDHKLYALDSGTGAILWTYLMAGEVRASSPVVAAGPDGKDVIIIGDYDGQVYAINADGSLSRTFATGAQIRSSPAISGTALYFGSADHKLYAFDIGMSAAGTPWPMYLYGPRRAGRVEVDTLAITEQPAASVGLVNGSALTLTVGAVGQGPLTFQWALNGAAIAGATNSTYFVPDPGAADIGTYTVKISGPQGSVESAVSTVEELAVPSIVTQPESQSVNAGAGVTLSVDAQGGNLAFQWSFAGTAIPGATGPSLVLANVGAIQDASYGTYTVTVMNGLGSITSNPASLTVVTSARLVNLSARANIEGSSQLLVVGLSLGGGSKTVLVRGVGPDLVKYSITDPLADPVLTLFAKNDSSLAVNQGWDANGQGPAIAAAETATGAFSLPAGSADAALLSTLAGGQYTAQIAGLNGEAGIALAEFYDDDPAGSASRLVNISARASVQSDVNLLIAGFSISGTTAETVLIRGAGPTLAAAPFNLSGVLSNPILTLYDKNDQVIASDSGWGNAPAPGDSTVVASPQAATPTIFKAVGAFDFTSADSADSALVVTLPPGQYTAQVSGGSQSGGVALVEVYEVR